MRIEIGRTFNVQLSTFNIQRRKGLGVFLLDVESPAYVQWTVVEFPGKPTALRWVPRQRRGLS